MKNNYECRSQNPIVTTKLTNNNKPPVHTIQQNLFEVEAITPIKENNQKRESNYVFDIVDALSAPILTFSKHWADVLPERILNIVQLARMIALMKGEQTATYAECVIYMYTRTLEAPMDHEWTDIYTHVSCTTLEDWFGEDHWNDTRAPKELSDWLQSKLTGLRRHIYEKRREILKQKCKSQQVPEKKPSEEKNVTPNNQQTLFQ